MSSSISNFIPLSFFLCPQIFSMSAYWDAVTVLLLTFSSVLDMQPHTWCHLNMFCLLVHRLTNDQVAFSTFFFVISNDKLNILFPSFHVRPLSCHSHFLYFFEVTDKLNMKMQEQT